jgi:hypothetical protein
MMKDMRNCLLTSITAMILAAFLSVTFSATGALVTSDWNWFARSGALVTVCGVILSVRPIIRKGYKGWLASLRVIDGGSLEPTPEEREESRQLDIDARAIWIGALMALGGALLSAYGDLVGNLNLYNTFKFTSHEQTSQHSEIESSFYAIWITCYLLSFLGLVFWLPRISPSVF